MSERVKIANADELSPGTGMVVETNEKSLAVFNVDGTFYVIDNTCVHRGGPLGEGDLEGEVVTCPWHNWEYNVCLLYTSPSPRDLSTSRMPSSA